MWKSIFSGFLILIVIVLKAQEAPRIFLADSTPKFSFRSLELNYNILRLSQNILKNLKSSQEIQMELRFHEKFFLVADVGFANIDRGRTYRYKSEGSFWRLGIDANMAKNTDSGNMIGMGLRYAKASFGDRITFRRRLADQSEKTIRQDVLFSNPDVSSRWMELVFKMRIKVWRQFYSGYTLRYQFFLQTDGADSNLKPFDIPGYGKTTRSNSFGFDYYVGWRFDF